MLKSTSPSP